MDRADGRQGGLLPSMGRYQLLRRLALGGMAEIYLARAEGAEGFAKPVVIKRILPVHADDPILVTLFMEEARLAARLNHANITQIFDFDEDDQGGYYMAMEYVHGRDLREVLDRCRQLGRRIGDARSAQICVRLLEGLSYAHEFSRRGRPLEIVHRDISPRNVLLGFNGDTKLTDFGIARAKGLGPQEKGVVRGKLLYMSPEQIRGQELDRRSDLFSVGLVLYEMLTGHRALEGPDGDITPARTALAEFPPVEELRPDLSSGLSAILDVALRRDRCERYDSGREFLRELQGFLFNEVSSPVEIELEDFLRSIFPEVADLTVTVSSARALMILRETSGLELSSALRQALVKGRSGRDSEEEDDHEQADAPRARHTGPTRPDRPAALEASRAGGPQQSATGASESSSPADTRAKAPLAATVMESRRLSKEEIEGLQAASPPPATSEPGAVDLKEASPEHGAPGSELFPTRMLPSRRVTPVPCEPNETLIDSPVPEGLHPPQRTLIDSDLAGLDEGSLQDASIGTLAQQVAATRPPRPVEQPREARSRSGLLLLVLLLLGGVGVVGGLWASGAWKEVGSGEAPAEPGPAARETAGPRLAVVPPTASDGGAADGVDGQEDAARPAAATTSERPRRGPGRRSPRTRSTTRRSRQTRSGSRALGRAEASHAQPAKARGGAVEARARLVVNARPYAELYVDGKGPYETPFSRELPPGRHKLRLVNSALGTEQRHKVFLEPGKSLTRSYDMSRP